jgi:hypothetical protein
MPYIVEDEPLAKKTLNLYKGDYERIGAIYPELGAGKAIRTLVRMHLEAKEKAVHTPVPKVAIDFDPVDS